MVTLTGSCTPCCSIILSKSLKDRQKAGLEREEEEEEEEEERGDAITDTSDSG